MQIFNTDRTQLFAALETIPTDRPNRTDETQLTFAKLSPNVPTMPISWFYPGETAGDQLVYSPQQERQLSGGNQTTVLARNIPQVE